MDTNMNQSANQKIEKKLRECRKLVSGLGTMLGKTICFVAVDNVDLTHKEKEINNSHPRLVKPLRKFMVNTITVAAQQIVSIGDDLYVEFNGDSKLRARITADQDFFSSADSTEAIEEAIERAETNLTPIFFQNRKKLTEEVNFRNKEEMKKAEQLANDFLNQMGMLKSLIETQTTDCDDYYRQYGL